MKKNLKYVVFILCTIFIGVFHVNASMDITTTKDLVRIKASNPAASAIYWNTTNSYNSAKNISSLGSFSSSTGYISLKNGTYYFWAVNSSGGKTVKGPVTISTSCTDQTHLNEKSENPFRVERCYIKKAGSTEPVADGNTTIASCGDGYYLDQSKVSVVTNECKNLNVSGVKQRYCKVVFQFQCTKKTSSGGNQGGGGGGTTVKAASLSSLSVSSGALSPKFASGTKSYKVTVGTNVDSININATAASGSSFVSGYGSRSVKLNYGTNKVLVKVKNSAGKVTTYTLNITRTDGRSTVNTLASLDVSTGTLTPAFASNVNNYTVNVTNDIQNITLEGVLTDQASYYVTGFEPRQYELSNGTNTFYIKVSSQKGEINVYTINVFREELPTECTTDTSNKALLKGITMSVDIAGVEIDQIQDFDPHINVYNDIKVPYAATSLTIEGYSEDEGDTVEVFGAEDFEVAVPKEVTIKVTSKMCPNYSNVYTLNVTRQVENPPSDNAELVGIKIENHDEFEFSSNVRDYDIVLNKGETELKITTDPADQGTFCDIQGNEDLKLRSTVTIVCTAEDRETTETYTISVRDIKKGMSNFVIILIIILCILILIILVLRLLGYKIYFNFEVIGAFFRGIGEKIGNIFS